MRDPLSETPAPAADTASPIIPFPSHLARPSALPRFADAQVAPRRDETLVEKLNRALADIASIRRPLEGM
ncbi:hypothetical protein EZH22_22350 [Xanthobacter dioxanivorans]|uniref:Uncharacterized protein n=1 Tax=Xanthobacter dioxanivorans TaxID=2528964 RepID=A0A974SHV5_9HYPH|nr:hypothetical protein [Xanthobacter dioxanivorans]QRG05752.1 hypothetical protein EZH22_22350 [Xanthobacter dioxanivorans]